MPTYRPTNAGLQTKGTLWAGFDPTISSLVAGVFMLSVMATFGSISVLRLPWLLAIPFCFLLPNILLLVVIFTLVVGRPPRHLRDWLESRVFRRTAVDLRDLSEPAGPGIE